MTTAYNLLDSRWFHRTPWGGKPVLRPGNYTLNRAHPLARQLVVFIPQLEGGGNTVNLADSKILTRTSGASWQYTRGGLGIKCNGTNENWAGPGDYLPIRTSTGDGLNAFTSLVIDDAAANATRRFLFGQAQTASRGFGIMANATNQTTNSSGNWCIWTRTSTTPSSLATSGATFVDGKVHMRYARRQGTGTMHLWQDGVKLATGTSNGDIINFSTTAYLTTGAYENNTDPCESTTTIYACAAWNRYLTEAELKGMPFTFWQLLKPVAETDLPFMVPVVAAGGVKFYISLMGAGTI